MSKTHDHSTNHPLDSARDLALRKKMSALKQSSFFEIWQAAPKGSRIKTLTRFLKTHFGVGKLSSEEFIKYGLVDQDISDDEALCFLGKAAQDKFHAITNDRTWFAVTKNKLLFETLIKGADLPCPKTLAVYDRKGRGLSKNLLDSDEALIKFLINKQNHPVFCKPTTGVFSIGAFKLDGVEGDNLIINGHHKMPASDVVRYIKEVSPKGYLFQKLLVPHDHLVKLNGKAISSVRFMVVVIDGKPHLHSCAMKLPSSGSVADNFWRDGAILCEIEPEKGVVTRSVINQGAKLEVIHTNPQTGNALTGFTLPDYVDANRLVLDAAKLFPGIQTQAWDVAFTKDGPVLLEVNHGGDLSLLQMASGKGVFTGHYRQLVENNL